MTTYSQAVCHAGQHKEKVYTMYSAMSGHTKALRHGSQVLPANYTMPAFFRKRSPDGATPNGGGRHLVEAYYSFIDPEGTKG